MSFFEGDTRKGEQPAPPPRALNAVEIGVIIGTIAVFIALVGALFFYRAHKAKKRREENGERIDDEHQLQDKNCNRNDDASSREEETTPARPPPLRKKRVWDPYEGHKDYEADVERGENHEMRDRHQT